MNRIERKSEPRFAEIAAGIRDHMAAQPLYAPSARIPLNVPSYGPEEVIEALDSMLSGWMTMGKKVKAFEDAWAAYIGVEHAVMTNSGSSANLLALRSLDLRPDSEVITPALTWATTVFPIAQAGYIPVLVDVDRETYNISVRAIERALTGKTRAIMPVHLLGNPCDMDGVMALARRHGLAVIEDACEAHGATYHGQKVGSFGDMATFSFFFSHHISTIEGGMVATNHTTIADECQRLRAFGWTRNALRGEFYTELCPDIDPRFMFVTDGYNFRPTEVQGAFGIHQVPRLEGYIAIRRENMGYWNGELAKWQDWIQLPSEAPDTRHVSFAYAITVKEAAPFTGKELQAHLESRGVETRPIEAGAMHLQPAMKRIKWVPGDSLENAEYIHKHGFFFGNHHGITRAQREAVVGYVDEFMRRF